MKSIERKRAAGFSLLELVVAIAILAMSLGALYQAAGGATRNIRVDEKYAYSVELARSLLARNAFVPYRGLNESGSTEGGFRWTVQTRPVAAADTGLAEGMLHHIHIAVRWDDGPRERQVELFSVVSGYGS